MLFYRSGLRTWVAQAMVGWFKTARDVDCPILDTAFLERLQKHIGRDATRELLADGMIELSDKIDRLSSGGADLPDVAGLTHDISGAAGHMGLTALSRAASDANQKVRNTDAPDPAQLVADVTALAGPSLEALSAFIRQPEDHGTDTDALPDGTHDR